MQSPCPLTVLITSHMEYQDATFLPSNSTYYITHGISGCNVPAFQQYLLHHTWYIRMQRSCLPTVLIISHMEYQDTTFLPSNSTYYITHGISGCNVPAFQQYILHHTWYIRMQRSCLPTVLIISHMEYQDTTFLPSNSTYYITHGISGCNVPAFQQYLLHHTWNIRMQRSCLPTVLITPHMEYQDTAFLPSNSTYYITHGIPGCNVPAFQLYLLHHTWNIRIQRSCHPTVLIISHMEYQDATFLPSNNTYYTTHGISGYSVPAFQQYLLHHTWNIRMQRSAFQQYLLYHTWNIRIQRSCLPTVLIISHMEYQDTTFLPSNSTYYITHGISGSRIQRSCHLTVRITPTKQLIPGKP